MPRKILLVPAVVIPAIVLAYAGTDFAEEHMTEKAIHDAYDEGIMAIRYADSGEAGKILALKKGGWYECCGGKSESCVPKSPPVTVTDTNLADVPRIKAMLEIARGEEFSDSQTYHTDGSQNIYEVYGGEDTIHVETGMPGQDVRQYAAWMNDLRIPVLEYKGEFFVLGSYDNNAMWSSLMGTRGC